MKTGGGAQEFIANRVTVKHFLKIFLRKREVNVKMELIPLGMVSTITSSEIHPI